MYSEFVDISLVKSQNQIAVQAATYLSIKELESIDLSKVLYSNKRDISDNCNRLYYIEFDSGISLQLLDIITIDKYPVTRFTCIRICNGNFCQVDVKCKHSKKNISYFKLIISKALNFAQYKSSNDAIIVKKNIINNFSKQISSLISKDVLERIKFLLTVISTDNSILYNDNYQYSFTISNIKVLVNPYSSNIIKFTILDLESNIEKYIFLNRDEIGLSNIHLILQKALSYKK